MASKAYFIPYFILALLLFAYDVANANEEEGEDTSCYFSSSTEVANNVNISKAINKKCREERFAWIESKYGIHAVGVDDQLCGVTNVTDEHAVMASEVCFSKIGEGVKSSFMHKVLMPRELYYDDYVDIKKTRFKLKRKAIENEWNMQLMEDMDKAWKFERITVMAIAPRTDNFTKDGIEVEALVQFGSDSVSVDGYKSAFVAATEDNMVGNFELERIEEEGRFKEVVTEPPECVQTPKDEFGPNPANKNGVTVEMWEASGGDALPKAKIASSTSFSCPTDTWISKDDDGFDEYDNKYTILCTALGRYNTPREWPKCVAACEASPPAAPDITGLQPVEAKIRVPSGGKGRYVCTDATLGVERSGTEYYEVLCVNTTTTTAEYELPETDEAWPRCLTRTTTYSPVLPIAVNEMLSKSKTTLERRKAIDQYEEGFQVDWGEDWFLIVFVPLIICLGLGVLITCCLLRDDSRFYNICADRNPYLRH